MDIERYFMVRLPFDRRRAVLWRTLVDSYFQRFAPDGSHVLELGAGYCDFINSIQADKKYAIDLWPEVVNRAGPDVIARIGSPADLGFIPDDSLDLVFASNLFEHLTQAEFSRCLKSVQAKMKLTGRLLILQPNFRYAFREYFDDFTHQSIWTEVSIADFLAIHGFHVEQVNARFLPLSLKSRFPVSRVIISLYLKLPKRPLAKQMLVIAKVSSDIGVTSEPATRNSCRGES